MLVRNTTHHEANEFMTQRTKFIQLLERSYHLYKDNFLIFFQLGIAQALLGLTSIQLAEVLGEQLWALSFIIALVLLYFQMRLSLALVFLVVDTVHDKTANIHEYYFRSKEKIWQYIGANLTLVIIVAIPLSLFVLLFSISENIIIQGLVILLGGSLGLFLVMHYFLAPYIVLLDSSSNYAFKESFKLIKPVRILAAFVALTSIILLFAPYLLFEAIQIEGMMGALINSILHAIIAPLNICIVLLFYQNILSQQNHTQQGQLEDKKIDYKK